MMSCSGTMAEREAEEEEELLKLAEACADDVVEDEADVDVEEAGVVDMEEGEGEAMAAEAEGEASTGATGATGAGTVAGCEAAAAACCCGVRGLRWLAAALEGSDSRGMVIQGWRRSSSMRMRSPGLIRRHRLMRSWHSKVRRVRNLISAEQICSSCSKGMSPHTMS